MAALESHNGYYLWNYIPSEAAAGIFAALFIISTAAHAYKVWTTKAKFCWAFTIGCFLLAFTTIEFIGYCARASAHNKTGKLMPYIIQNLFILVAPALFAASIYMTLGRIIRSIGAEKHSVIRVNWLTKTFVYGDILSFLVQGGSAGLMFQSSTVKMGEGMVVGGLFIQIVMFGLFALTAVIFQSQLRKDPTPASYSADIPWKRSLHMLYTVSALIMVRSIFRVIEYLMGQTGYPLKHEWTLYIFDSVLMFAVTFIFYLRYPNELERGISRDSANVQMVPQKVYNKV
ncbi:RTA1 like protein [Acephala macrosclerotiorum]|nr:RTA1 like protein [Acephala macrosclerotiorum]